MNGVNMFMDDDMFFEDDDNNMQYDPESERSVIPASPLRVLVDLLEKTMMKNRIAFGQRLDAIAKGNDTAPQEIITMYEEWSQVFMDLELQCRRQIARISRDYPIIVYMKSVKGIGPSLSARIVAHVDIHKAPTVSSLWKYAGYGVTDGAADRPRKGEKLAYNKRLKTAVYLASVCMNRTRGPYRDYYLQKREYVDNLHPDWDKGRRHYTALRHVAKLFLSHLWEVWRDIEGLPTRVPYILEKSPNVHTHYLDPKDFGWEYERKGR